MSFKAIYSIFNTKFGAIITALTILLWVLCPQVSSASVQRNPAASLEVETAIHIQGEEAHQKELREKRLRQKSSSKIMATSLKKWEEVKNVEYADAISSKRVNLFVPTDIKAGSDGNQVQQEVMDQSLNSFVQGKLTPQLSIFRTVKQVEKSMQYDLVLAPADEHGVQQKFNLQYLAFQNMARLKYNGYLDANMKYFFSNSHVQAELAHPLTKSMQFSLTYEMGSIKPDGVIEVPDNTGMMHIQYNWN